jgi:hypothetical protein
MASEDGLLHLLDADLQWPLGLNGAQQRRGEERPAELARIGKKNAGVTE